jgi:HEAT repeat protein
LILGDRAGDRLVAKALQLLSSDPAPSVRAEAARVVMDACRNTPTICRALKRAVASDEEGYVRHQSAEALAELDKADKA